LRVAELYEAAERERLLAKLVRVEEKLDEAYGVRVWRAENHSSDLAGVRLRR
jgi:hypothetical protein